MVSKFRARLAGLFPPYPWFLGRARVVTIAPSAQGGYVLKILRTQGCEWVTLPAQARVYDAPDQAVFDAAAQALTARGVAWMLPWCLDAHGNLTAPLETIRKGAHP